MDKLIYNNPILHSDFSDPDVIRHGDDFFMVSSSFNFSPAIPVLHSKNLVEWQYIGSVMDKLPFEEFANVVHGGGAWAPSIRYHNGIFYCIIPFPDYGVFVCKTANPFDGWSKPWKLIDGKGIIDPCPIWTDEGCFLAVAFAKSRIGFNSKIGMYRVSEDLTENISGAYKIVYDGTNNSPTIEGPKLHYINNYYYILSPAGGVKTGWQVALRSKNIYGPYESKIVLMQGDSAINGPHQGALIDVDDNNNWAFIHFQDKGAYGRIIHLEPVTWNDDWPIFGVVKDNFIAGTPISQGPYPIMEKTFYEVKTKFNFLKNEWGLLQIPANTFEDAFFLSDGLNAYCMNYDGALCDNPYMLCQKIFYKNFEITCTCKLAFDKDGDSVGVGIFGKKYAFIKVEKRGEKIVVGIGKCDGDGKEITVFWKNICEERIKFCVRAFEDDSGNLAYNLGLDGEYYKQDFVAERGEWVGAHFGIFALSKGKSNGKIIFTNLRQNKKNKR